jgi:hypothetical protein
MPLLSSTEINTCLERKLPATFPHHSQTTVSNQQRTIRPHTTKSNRILRSMRLRLIPLAETQTRATHFTTQQYHAVPLDSIVSENQRNVSLTQTQRTQTFPFLSEATFPAVIHRSTAQHETQFSPRPAQTEHGLHIGNLATQRIPETRRKSEPLQRQDCSSRCQRPECRDAKPEALALR